MPTSFHVSIVILWNLTFSRNLLRVCKSSVGFLLYFVKRLSYYPSWQKSSNLLLFGQRFVWGCGTIDFSGKGYLTFVYIPSSYITFFRETGDKTHEMRRMGVQTPSHIMTIILTISIILNIWFEWSPLSADSWSVSTFNQIITSCQCCHCQSLCLSADHKLIKS